MTLRTFNPCDKCSVYAKYGCDIILTELVLISQLSNKINNKLINSRYHKALILRASKMI